MTPLNSTLSQKKASQEQHSPVMDAERVTILRSLGEFVLLAASTAAVPLIVYIDNVILHNDVSEYSITEVTQETLLLLSTVLVLVAAWRRVDRRGFLALVGGFFACMLIRELDFLFDLVHHGLWLYPALLTAAASIACAIAYRKTVLSAMAAFAGTRSCVYMTIGLLVVVLLSRLFGSGRLIWSNIIATDHYKTLFKTIIQEGLELFGYVFVFYASCLLVRKQ